MPSSRNGEKKMQSGDHGKDKSRNVPLSLNKNKMQENENKKRIAPITSAVKEKKMRSTDSMEMKMHNRDNKEKKRSAPSVLPKENKFQKLTNTKKENKRKEPSTPFNKEKKMRANDKDKKVGSDDKGKEKKIQGDKDKKVQSGDKNERKAPLTFFKFICNNFKEFLALLFNFKQKKEQLEPVGSIVSKQRNTIPVCANHAIPHQSEHQFSQQEDGKSSNCVTPVTLLPVKAEVLELDDHCLLKINFQFCIPSTTQTWLELPKSLSNAVRCKGRQDQNVIMFKDPMKRLWPVFYHEKPVFVGFTTGWKPFVTANNLQIGDHCELLEELDEEEIVYRVQITKK